MFAAICALLAISCTGGDAADEVPENTATLTIDTTSNRPLDHTDSASPIREGIVFETDFSQDTGYRQGFTNLWNGGAGSGITPPTGWDGVKVVGDGEFLVVEGEGADGGNALRIRWDPNASQPTMSLGKHLTGDEQTGFDELYIRYRVRLPNGFMVADGAEQIGYWKWGRLWQNTSVDHSEPNKWTENRANSGYVVWNFNNGIPYTAVNATWSENEGNLDGGSNSGDHQRVGFFVSGSDPHTAPGHFESIWDINDADRRGTLENNTTQDWHTLEFRFRLASTAAADDGAFEVFFDGVPQGDPTEIVAGAGAPERDGIPTANGGSGFNFFTFFDNMHGWNARWGDEGVDGYIWVDDVVVSTQRIGHDYNPG